MHREAAVVASKPYCKCNTSVDIQKRAIKGDSHSHSFRITIKRQKRSKSAREKRTALYKSGQLINNNRCSYIHMYIKAINNINMSRLEARMVPLSLELYSCAYLIFTFEEGGRFDCIILCYGILQRQ